MRNVSVSALAAAAVIALHAGPAWATCAPGTACEDGWLFNRVLPLVVIIGVAVWAIGPVGLALADKLASLRRKDEQ